MEAHSQDYKHFSSDVRLELRVEGQTIDLAGVGPNDIVPRHPLELAPCDGEVVMTIDGERLMWRVRLDNGAVPFDKIIDTTPLGDVVRL